MPRNITPLTLDSIREIFGYIRDNTESEYRQKTLATLINEITKIQASDSDSIEKMERTTHLIRKVTEVGAGFGFGAENDALTYLASCIETKQVSISFNYIRSLFKNSVTGVSSLFASPTRRYANTPFGGSSPSTKEAGRRERNSDCEFTPF